MKKIASLSFVSLCTLAAAVSLSDTASASALFVVRGER
jgi:hypothetical protein